MLQPQSVIPSRIQMIKIVKTEKPKTLQNKQKEWTDALLREDLEKAVPPKYRKKYNCPDIKMALVNEAAGKCAYCERKIIANQFGDVEHILPVSSDRSLMFEWTNLVLACQKCNNSKSNYSGSDGEIIHPVADEPESELFLLGPGLYCNSKKGRVTIDEIGLNRSDLMDLRHKRIEQIYRLIDLYNRTDEPIKALLGYEIKREMFSASEFSLAVRCLVKSICPELIAVAS